MLKILQFNPFMTEADIIQKPVRKSMDWSLSDIGLCHERVNTDKLFILGIITSTQTNVDISNTNKKSMRIA